MMMMMMMMISKSSHMYNPDISVQGYENQPLMGQDCRKRPIIPHVLHIMRKSSFLFWAERKTNTRGMETYIIFVHPKDLSIVIKFTSVSINNHIFIYYIFAAVITIE